MSAPFRTAPDTLDAIRADLDALFKIEPAIVAYVDPAGAAAASARFYRRALEQAADHAAALLPLLDGPRLVEPGFVALDRTAALDALDAILVALDAMDGDTDLEDEGEAEPSLASPERHPMVPWEGNHVRHYVTRDRQDTQARWADGSRQDTEADIADERHDGDDEDLEAEPNEPILGATEKIDQTAWGKSGDHDCEFDATDCIDRQKPRDQVWASVARRDEMAALWRRAHALRFRSPAPRDPDAVTPIGPGRVAWSGPTFTRDGYPAVGTVRP